MKKLGIIGGLGPESTVDYYQKIIALYRERRRDGSYPQFIINSIDLTKGLNFMEVNNLPGMAGYLLELSQVREMLDGRYDDLKSGRVKPIAGEAFFDSLRQREDELLKQRNPK